MQRNNFEMKHPEKFRTAQVDIWKSQLCLSLPSIKTCFDEFVASTESQLCTGALFSLLSKEKVKATFRYKIPSSSGVAQHCQSQPAGTS